MISYLDHKTHFTIFRPIGALIDSSYSESNVRDRYYGVIVYPDALGIQCRALYISK